MKIFKFFEGWASISDKYLVNRDTENGAMIKRFIEVYNLSNLIFEIWEYGKKIDIYPNKITDEEILYIIDGCKIAIKIKSGIPIEIIKSGIKYVNNTFAPVIIQKEKLSPVYELIKNILPLFIKKEEENP